MVQDMLVSDNKSQKGQYDPYNLKLILTVLLVVQGVIAIIIYFIPPFSGLELNQKINIFLSWAIVQFTLIGGISTWLQFAVAEKRNKIEDSRFELENVYGPLFTLLKDYKEWVEAVGEPTMSVKAASILNEKFSTYPHVLSTKLYDFWKENIRPQTPKLSGENEYWISTQFVADFFDEYEKKVKSYRKLLGK